jgi:hypothetical protein
MAGGPLKGGDGMRRAAWWGLMVGLGALVTLAIPDIRRYLKIRTM